MHAQRTHHPTARSDDWKTLAESLYQPGDKPTSMRFVELDLDDRESACIVIGEGQEEAESRAREIVEALAVLQSLKQPRPLIPVSPMQELTVAGPTEEHAEAQLWSSFYAALSARPLPIMDAAEIADQMLEAFRARFDWGEDGGWVRLHPRYGGTR